MKRPTCILSIKFLLILFFSAFSMTESLGQCTTPNCNEIPASNQPIVATANGQSFCIKGPGIFTGNIDFNGHSNVSICIDNTVIVNDPGVTIDNSNNAPGNSITNYGTWNRYLYTTLRGSTSFYNWGTVNAPTQNGRAFDLAVGAVFENRGTFTVTGGGIIYVNSGGTFRTIDGSETNIDGTLHVPSDGTVDVGGVINTKNFYVNSNTDVKGIPPMCSGIIIQDDFTNLDPGTGGDYGIYTNKPPNGGGNFNSIKVNPNKDSLKILSHPVDTFLCEGKTTRFKVAAQGVELRYKWQILTPGGYVNINDGGPYSGTTTNTLVITGASYELNGMKYRASVTDCPYTTKSNPATLIVHPNPIINIDLGSSNTFCFKGTKAIKVTGTFDTLKWTAPAPIQIPNDVTSYIPVVGGFYTIDAKNKLGCASSATVEIKFDSTLSYFNLGDDQKVVCSNTLSPIEVPTGNYTGIVWDAPEVISNLMSHQPGTSGKYKVTVTIASGCSLADSVNVDFRNWPNAFDLGPTIFNPCLTNGLIIVPPGPYTSIKWIAPPGVTIADDTNKHKPTVKGDYKVTVSDGVCSNSDELQVDFIDTINVDLGDFNAISCQDQRVQLKVTEHQGLIYDWTVDGQPIKDSLYTLTPTRSGKYKVKVYDASYPECASVDSIEIIYSPDFKFNFSGDSTVSCFGAGFALCVNEGSVFEWFKDGVVLPDNQKCYSPTEDGYFTLKVTDQNGCSKTEGIYVKHYEKLDIGLNGKDTVSCYPYTIYTIKATPGPGYTYQWFPNTSTTSNEYTPVLGNDTIQKYKVTVTNADGCFDSDSVTVRFPKKMEFNFSGDSTVSCYDAGFELCATGGIKYDWKPSSLVPPNTQGCFSPTQAGTYTLTATDINGCVREESIYVKHYNKLDIGLNGADTASCFPYKEYKINVNLTGPGYKYEWTPNVSTTHEYIPEFKNDSVEKYKVKVTNPDGCIDTDSVTVKYVPEILFPFIQLGDTTACEYVNYTIRPGPGYLRYEWGSNISNNIAGPDDSTYTPKDDGKYWVTVFTIRGGCSKTSDTVSVDFVPDPSLDLGPKQTQCKDQAPIELDAGPGYDSYQWENNPAFNEQTYSIPFPEFSGASIENQITVTVTYEKVCKTIASKTIRFINQSAVNIGPSVTVCPGQPVTIIADSLFDFYFWTHTSNPDVSISSDHKITVTQKGVYGLTVNSVCGTEYVTKEIKHWENPTLDLGEDTLVICLGKSYDIINHKDSNNVQNYTYQWSEMSSEIIFDSKTIPFRVNTDGLYYATAIDSNNCTATDSIRIVTNDKGDCFTIPNLITPNLDDNLNNTFHINGILQKLWKLEIYNRWGDKVYESKAYDNDWSAQGLEDGMYFYHLEHPTNGIKYSGWVQVVGRK